MKFQMKKSHSIVLSCILILGLTACSSEDTKIKTAITSFFTALNHKNPQSAKLYATQESADILNLIQQQMIASPDTSSNTNEKFLISNIKINGNIATASVRSETQQTPLTVTVKKIGNDWKVAFDKNSIATMMGHNPANVQSQTDSATMQSAPALTPTAPGQTLNLSDTSVTPVSR